MYEYYRIYFRIVGFLSQQLKIQFPDIFLLIIDFVRISGKSIYSQKDNWDILHVIILNLYRPHLKELQTNIFQDVYSNYDSNIYLEPP